MLKESPFLQRRCSIWWLTPAKLPGGEAFCSVNAVGPWRRPGTREEDSFLPGNLRLGVTASVCLPLQRPTWVNNQSLRAQSKNRKAGMLMSRNGDEDEVGRRVLQPHQRAVVWAPGPRSAAVKAVFRVPAGSEPSLLSGRRLVSSGRESHEAPRGGRHADL